MKKQKRSMADKIGENDNEIEKEGKGKRNGRGRLSINEERGYEYQQQFERQHASNQFSVRWKEWQ
jgi:hypothetical protein